MRRDISITLTGADEETPLAELFRLADRGAEIGILFSTTNSANRYPRARWVVDAVEALGSSCAVHVCGSAARRAFLDGELPWIRVARRVQVNGTLTAHGSLRALEVAPEIIVQFRATDAGRSILAMPGLSYLVDGSGGRGISPEVWFRPGTSRPVGFAGGLGPDNLTAELCKIASVARNPWWVDMESKLRDDRDRFSPELAHQCVDAFQQFLLDRDGP